MGRRDAIVLLNGKSGARRHVRRGHSDKLRAALTSVGLDADLRIVDGKSLEEAARKAVQEAPALLVAAGGDGTVSAVASAVSGTKVALGVVPFGTLNHFAKDAGIPLDLENAVNTLRRGRVKRVDMATVNDLLFINNASIGAYPSVVRTRRNVRNRFGWGKWTAMAIALLSVSRNYPLVRVDLQVEERREPVKSPFLFVGNNRYDLRLFQMGARNRLDRGELCVYFSNDSNRREIARMLMRSAIGRLSQDRDFRTLYPPRITVRSRSRRLRVALDGEVRMLTSPLRFASRPKSLRLIVPKEDNA